MVMEKYSTKLQKILAASGLSQEKLADLLSVSFVTLNSWVNSKSEPRPAMKEKIDLIAADFLGSDSCDRDQLKATKQLATKQHFSASRLLKNRDLLDSLTVGLTYHSNATEGSTMTREDVSAVLFDHAVLSNRSAIEQREAINHQSALYFLIEAVSDPDFKFTPELIKSVHLRLMNGVISNAGTYRNHGVRIRGAHVPLANYLKIPDLIDNWCQLANSETTDNIELLATTHAKFEQIHPFSDGNGRTGRMLLFALALSRSLVPPILKREKRSAYYKYLELCQLNDYSDPLELFIATAILETAALLDETL